MDGSALPAFNTPAALATTPRALSEDDLKREIGESLGKTREALTSTNTSEIFGVRTLA